MKFSLYHIPFDPLDEPKRVMLRQNYLQLLEQGKIQPLKSLYDLVEIPGDCFETKKTDFIPSEFSPFPEIHDKSKITVENYRDFINDNGIEKFIIRLSERIANDNNKPFLLGIDHSLTAANIIALHKRGIHPRIIILDAHLDALEMSERIGFETNEEPLTAGNFLKFLWDRRIVERGQVTILGVQDDPELSAPANKRISKKYRDAYNIWKDRFKIINIREMRKYGIETFLDNDTLSGQGLYLSIDTDVASSKEIWSVRFFEGAGLTFAETKKLIKDIIESTQKENIKGIDFTEWDPLLLNIKNRNGNRDKIPELLEYLLGLIC